MLTFLYTSCPDICPLITSKLRESYQLINGVASRVAFLAVTVDPERDTVQQVYEYSQKMGKVRVAYGSTFRPVELAHDIQVLLGR